jgi:YjbR protein
MKAKDFRRMALAFAGAVEGSHMNHPDFRANGRIFATLHEDDRHGMVSLTPAQQEKFLKDDPSAFVPESGAWGRQGCTRVTLALVEEDMLGEAMTLAWQNVMAKRTSRRRRT